MHAMNLERELNYEQKKSALLKAELREQEARNQDLLGLRNAQQEIIKQLERELNDALLNLKRERGDRESNFKLAKSGRVIKIPVWMDGDDEILSFQAHNVIALERAKDELNAARNEIARLNGQTCYACQCGGTKLDAQERNDWRACASELAEAMRGSSEILRQSALAKFEKLKSQP